MSSFTIYIIVYEVFPTSVREFVRSHRYGRELKTYFHGGLYGKLNCSLQKEKGHESIRALDPPKIVRALAPLSRNR